jgi:hypothetical protein
MIEFKKLLNIVFYYLCTLFLFKEINKINLFEKNIEFIKNIV